MCRKIHGAAFATLAIAPIKSVVYVKGEDYLTHSESSDGVSRLFCKICGCRLTIDVAEVPQSRWYTPATLDDSVHPARPRTNDITLSAQCLTGCS